jgi:hypothetical protein
LQSRIPEGTWVTPFQFKRTWATPFEVHLAARRFNCIIHLFLDNVHYCFQPDRHRQSAASLGPHRIFLHAKITPSGEFHFQWYKPNPQLYREKTLWAALRTWFKQDDVRPLSFRELGCTELEFKSKCSNVVLEAHKHSGWRKELQKADPQQSSVAEVVFQNMLSDDQSIVFAFNRSHIVFTDPFCPSMHRISV